MRVRLQVTFEVLLKFWLDCFDVKANATRLPTFTSPNGNKASSVSLALLGQPLWGFNLALTFLENYYYY